jgi:serine/threonine-protein kinase HipA
MLDQIGGECAGAVTFIPAGQPPERVYSYRSLSPNELVTTLKELPKRPLLAGKKGIRVSLAGAQDKIAVRIEGNEISVPLGGAPSSHILKPNIEHSAGVVFNEAFAMRLAAAVNLAVAKVETRTVEGIEYLLVALRQNSPEVWRKQRSRFFIAELERQTNRSDSRPYTILSARPYTLNSAKKWP